MQLEFAEQREHAHIVWSDLTGPYEAVTRLASLASAMMDPPHEFQEFRIERQQAPGLLEVAECAPLPASRKHSAADLKHVLSLHRKTGRLAVYLEHITGDLDPDQTNRRAEIAADRAEGRLAREIAEEDSRQRVAGMILTVDPNGNGLLHTRSSGSKSLRYSSKAKRSVMPAM